MSEYRKGLDGASREIAPTGWFALKVILVVIALSVGVGSIGYILGWFSEAAKVTQEQFGPRALLAKYEWFKDASAQLDKKQADITVYESRMKGMDTTYKSVDRIKWPREDREQYNIWSSEVAGVKAGYNGLAADYNAQMAKFNYAFTNVGDLPKGADKLLPREYRTYTTQ